MSLNDKKSQKSLKDIKKMCVAQDDGTLQIKISNYTEVFEDMEDFCDVFMNDTTLIQVRELLAISSIRQALPTPLLHNILFFMYYALFQMMTFLFLSHFLCCCHL